MNAVSNAVKKIHQPMPQQTRSIKDACEILGVSRTTIHYMITENQLRAIRVRRRVLILESEIQRILKGDPVAPAV
jgi:excisionase family DNA binding protein